MHLREWVWINQPAEFIHPNADQKLISKLLVFEMISGKRELHAHKNLFPLFRRSTARLHFSVFLQCSVANATWAEELRISQVCSVKLPKLILSALYPLVCSMSMPGWHWMPWTEPGRTSVSLGPSTILWNQTGYAFNCSCEGEIDSYCTWYSYIFGCIYHSS